MTRYGKRGGLGNIYIEEVIVHMNAIEKQLDLELTQMPQLNENDQYVYENETYDSSRFIKDEKCIIM